MENKRDLSKELLIDSDYYLPRAIYAGFLKRHNINTVEELLNCEFNENTFGGHRLQLRTYSSLRVFVALIRHQYLGEPLYLDYYFDKDIDIKDYRGRVPETSFIPLEEPIGDKKCFFLEELFGGRTNFKIGVVFKDFMDEMSFESKENNVPFQNVKVIDFFLWILAKDNKYGSLLPFANTYVKAYEKNKKLEEVNSVVLVFLRSQLVSCMKIREELDNQINSLKDKIDELSRGKESSVQL